MKAIPSPHSLDISHFSSLFFLILLTGFMLLLPLAAQAVEHIQPYLANMLASILNELRRCYGL